MNKIIELHVENFKRIKVVTIRPSSPTVVVGGRNAQGKTSALDAIMAALGGGRVLPTEPIRHGEKKARICVELDDFTVTRIFSNGANSKLEVKAKGGGIVKKPQAVLDALVGALTFDPLEFSRKPAKAQLETLREIAGLDLSKIDSQIAGLFEERKMYARDARRAAGAAESCAYHKDTPIDLVVVSELVSELGRMQAHNDKRRNLEGEIRAKERHIGTVCEQIARLTEERDSANRKLKQLKSRYEIGHWENIDELQGRITSAEEVNARVRENRETQDRKSRAEHLACLADGATDALSEAREVRAAMIRDAKLPVEGLTIGDDGVCYNGVPFAQASAAEAIRVSAAVGLALNPTIGVLLIRDGSLLDSDAMIVLHEMAAERQAQIWLERVGDGDEGCIVIEDGEVIESGAAS